MWSCLFQLIAVSLKVWFVEDYTKITKETDKPAFKFASQSEDLWAHVPDGNLSLRELKQCWSFKIKLEIALLFLKFLHGVTGSLFHTLSSSIISSEAEVTISADYIILPHFVSYESRLCFVPTSHLSHPETICEFKLIYSSEESMHPCEMVGKCKQRRYLLAASVQSAQY